MINSLLMHPDSYKRPLLFVLIALIAGILFFYHPRPADHDVHAFLPQKEVTLTGRVERFYTPKPKSNNVIVKVLSVDGKPAGGYIYARLAGFEPLWKDTLEIKGRLQEPYGVDLLGNFNWRKYLAHKHIFTEIKSSDVRVVKPAVWPWRVLRSVRGDILRVLNESFPPSLAHIAGGVLLGERGELDPALYTAFQDSGAIHLLVASGGNVGFVTLMSLAFCGLFGLGRKKALWVALGVAGIYTLIAGADAPLMRAYFMTVCGCGGYYLGRNSGVWQGLILSCVVILLWYPASLFETGFQMSFLATAGLIVGLANYPVPGNWPKWARFFAQIFVATLSVQLVLLPVFTNVFYKVSLTGLIANMLLVPLASVLLALSFAYYVLSACHAGILLYYPTVFCLEVFQKLVEFFAGFKASSLSVSAWGAGTIVAYYAGLFWVFHLPKRAFAKRLLIPLAAVAVLALGTQFVANRHTRVYLLDEWYKNVVLVKTSGGGIFVVGNALAPEKIENALRKLGRLHADAVLITDTKPSKFDYTSLAPVVIRPFENNWPNESHWTFGRTCVKLIWGLHETQSGRLWYNTGYSGTDRDDVSYCFSGPRVPQFCVGAGAKLVRFQHKTVDPVTNHTVEEVL